MSIELDQEILQDFLVEAGEILEELNEQLIALERNPEDQALLNAVFRGFHTIKGGAGFLRLTPLVDLCHAVEDVFNVLRQSGRGIDGPLMDVVLRVFDVVSAMFAQVQAGEQLAAVDPALIAELTRCQWADAVSVPAEAASADPVEREFEALLDTPGDARRDQGDITGQEFEALLDDLHGQGQAPAAGASPAAAPAANDAISDAEFEQLLDQLHGKGKAPTAAVPSEASAVLRATQDAAAGKPGTKDEPQPRAPASRTGSEATVRVDTRRLDDIMNLVGELVLARNRLTSLRSSFENEQVTQAVAALDLVTADLQGAVMKTRMQPIKKVYGRFPRLVRDLARSLDKEVELRLLGEDTDLDKNLVEVLADPLVHLVRNAVDHGIESPDIREAAGKPRRGTVVLAAEQTGDHIELRIEDDGAGMAADALREMAVGKGLMDSDTVARLSEKECFELIFLPGASTKAEVSDVSGRGVGMDVVKTRIAQLNGVIDIDSTPGEGTTLTIKVPLTLAILPTLMVVLGRRKFALPLAVVHEIFELDKRDTHVIDGQRVIHVRGKAPPLFCLRDWLLQPDEREVSAEEPQVVMVEIGHRTFGLVVDQVIGQEEVVIKPLGAMLQGLPGLSGATITGDGNIALILDVAGLLRSYGMQQ